MPIEIEKLRIANEIASFGLAAFKENAVEGISEIELAAEDQEFATVLASYRAFSANAREWHDISERAYYEKR